MKNGEWPTPARLFRGAVFHPHRNGFKETPDVMKNYTAQELADHIQALKKMFDKVQLTDPLTGQCFDEENGFAPFEEGCGCRWGFEDRCTNCSGYQAMHHHAASFKMEGLGGEVFAVTARPLCLEGRPLVIETASNVSAQMADWGHQADAQKRMLEQYSETQVRDFLTGVYNRQYVEGYFAHKLPQLFAQGQHVHAAIVDVRRFKALAQEYGDAVADQVLCYVPNWFRLDMTEGQFVARFHSDQFLLVEYPSRRTLPEFQASIQSEYDRIGGHCVCGSMNNKLVPIQLAIAIGGLLETEHGTWDELLALLMGRLKEAKDAGDGKVKYL